MAVNEFTHKLITSSDVYDGVFKIKAEDTIQTRNRILGMLIKIQEESSNVDFKESDYIEFYNDNSIKIDIKEFCEVNIKNIIDSKYEVSYLDEFNGCNDINCDCSDSLKAYSDKLIFMF